MPASPSAPRGPGLADVALIVVGLLAAVVLLVYGVTGPKAVEGPVADTSRHLLGSGGADATVTHATDFLGKEAATAGLLVRQRVSVVFQTAEGGNVQAELIAPADRAGLPGNAPGAYADATGRYLPPFQVRYDPTNPIVVIAVQDSTQFAIPPSRLPYAAAAVLPLLAAGAGWYRRKARAAALVAVVAERDRQEALRWAEKRRVYRIG